MALRFRQSFTLFPGVRLNVGKRGMSASFGVPGATVNISARGVRGTVGIPGSGLSYSAMLTSQEEGASVSEPAYWQPPQRFVSDRQPLDDGANVYVRPEGMHEIGSAAVESLTTAGLLDFRAMIIDAARQRKEIETDLADARTEHGARHGELSRKRRSLFRAFFKKRIAELEEAVPKLAAELERLAAWLEATHIEVEFDTDDTAQRAYGAVVRAYESLRSCTIVWDVTSDRDTNRVAERTSATRVVERRPVSLDYSKSELVRFGGRALRFANANGEDILIYPGVILMQRSDGAFALLDLRDVQVDFEGVNFIEEEKVPSDSEIVRHTWAKVNKDGSPDRRFRDNYQIPVCFYGRIKLTSPTGLTEEYQFSNASAAFAFGRAFGGYQGALRALGDTAGLPRPAA
jgi:hypothetical protein